MLLLLGTLWLHARNAPASEISLRFLADQNIPAGTEFQGTTLGGLSGIHFDPETAKLVAISDDRSKLNPARYYTFDVSVGESSLAIEPVAVTTLLTEAGQPFPKKGIDPEGIAPAPEGSFISSEGDMDADPRVNPEVFRVSTEGQVVERLALPANLLPNEGEQTQGVADNGALEGLTVDPDTGELWIGIEEPLVQDGVAANFERGSKNRFVRFSKDLATTREYVYEVEPAPRLSDDPEALGYNAVSEILALGGGQYLALERSAVIDSKGVRFGARIYQFEVGEATDVSAIGSLMDQSATPLKKRLLLDLQDIRESLAEGYRTLDNLEGMTVGPSLADGRKTLLLIADDNFTSEERTQVLAFAVE